MSDYYLVDYHLHTPRCGHARGDLRDYVKKALELGFREVGFADHFPLLHLQDSSLTMSLEEVPGYVEEVLQLREEFPGIAIKLGIEADYVPGVLEELEELLRQYPFDYIYGSIHYVDGWGFDDPRYIGGYNDWETVELYQRYFELLGDAAECGLFDILAHPDLVKKFGYRPHQDLREVYRTCLVRVARAGVAVEVNTSGLRKPAKEIYPTFTFIELCKELEIGLVLGSDAHLPEEVGMDFELALKMMEDAGYEEITIFEKRKASMRKLKRITA
jgi:histidinol-phosphatase (PHP family)